MLLRAIVRKDCGLRQKKCTAGAFVRFNVRTIMPWLRPTDARHCPARVIHGTARSPQAAATWVQCADFCPPKHESHEYCYPLLFHLAHRRFCRLSRRGVFERLRGFGTQNHHSKHLDEKLRRRRTHRAHGAGQRHDFAALRAAVFARRVYQRQIRQNARGAGGFAGFRGHFRGRAAGVFGRAVLDGILADAGAGGAKRHLFAGQIRVNQIHFRRRTSGTSKRYCAGTHRSGHFEWLIPVFLCF